jgi:hypothetical protein
MNAHHHPCTPLQLNDVDMKDDDDVTMLDEPIVDLADDAPERFPDISTTHPDGDIEMSHSPPQNVRHVVFKQCFLSTHVPFPYTSNRPFLR